MILAWILEKVISGKHRRDKCTISSERILEPVIDQYQSNDIAEEHPGIKHKKEQIMDNSRTVSQFWPTFVFEKK
jgi:hypothetical protein